MVVGCHCADLAHLASKTFITTFKFIEQLFCNVNYSLYIRLPLEPLLPIVTV